MAAGPGGVPERRDVYERLADDLRADITSGKYRPGDRLPSTLELMERTGVANLTVRGAYRVLVEEGLVESVPKRGFYVRRHTTMTWHLNQPRPGRKTGPPLLDGWEHDARAAGLEPSQEITVAIEDGAVLVAGQGAAVRLGLKPGSRVLARHATRSLRQPGSDQPSEPVSLASEYYDYALVRDSTLASPAPADPPAILRELGHPIASYRDELHPRVATTEERRLLALPQVSVVLDHTRTAHDSSGQPVLILRQITRADGATYTYNLT